MKNRMHTCAAALMTLVVMATVMQGGMQSVFATGKTITKSVTVASAKMTVSNTSSDSKGSDKGSTIDIKVGEVLISVDLSQGSATRSWQWPMLTRL